MRPSSPRPADTIRGSRRARANVSYAEPNLISKMRRPTKTMVDAVARDQTLIPGQRPPSSVIRIKRESSEQTDDQPRPGSGSGGKSSTDEWKPTTSSSTQSLSRPEPQSPTRNRDDPVKPHVADRISSRERRRSVMHPSENPTKQSTANAAIGALADPNRKDAPQTAEAASPGVSLEEAMDSLDIYDVRDSSPPSAARNEDVTTSQTRNTGIPPQRPSSSIHRSASTGTQPRPASARNTSRRQTLGGGGHNSNSNVGSNTSAISSAGVPSKLTTSASTSTSTSTTTSTSATEAQPRQNSIDVTAVATVVSGEVGQLRAAAGARARAANRRRSMMV